MAAPLFSPGYLVECYWPGVSHEKLTDAVGRIAEAVSGLRSQGRELMFLHTILVPADETVFWLFGGSEPDVREATMRARVPYERVLESMQVDMTLILSRGLSTPTASAGPRSRGRSPTQRQPSQNERGASDTP